MNIQAELSKFDVGSKEYIFFEKVFEKLQSNFVRKSVEENLRETHNKLNKAIQKYFQMHILYNAITRCAEHIEKSQEVGLDLNSLNEDLINVHPLFLNLVQKYLPPEQSSQEPKLFGLSHENTLKAYESKKSKIENAVFKKKVEDNINDFCKKLIQCIKGTIFSGGDWQNTFNQTIKDLESKVIRSSEHTEDQLKKQLRNMIRTFYEELSKGVALLSKSLSLHEQKLEFESGVSEFYLHRCRAVFLKIKFFELKLLEATYNKETMPALRKISAELDESERKLMEEQNEKRLALESYLKLGEEYEQFVDEYTRLTKSIREQQWAIDELKSRKSQYEASGHD